MQRALILGVLCAWLGLAGCGGGGGDVGPTGPFDVTGTWSVYVDTSSLDPTLGWTRASAQDIKLLHHWDTDGSIDVIFPVASTTPAGTVDFITGRGTFTVNYGGTDYDLTITMTGQDSFRGEITFPNVEVQPGIFRDVVVPVFGTRFDTDPTLPTPITVPVKAISLVDSSSSDWTDTELIVTDRYGVADAAATEDILSLSLALTFGTEDYVSLLIKFEGAPGGVANRECAVTFFSNAGYPKEGDFLVHVDLDAVTPKSQLLRLDASLNPVLVGEGLVDYVSGNYVEARVPLAGTNGLPFGVYYTRATIVNPVLSFPTNPEKDGTQYVLINITE